MSQSGPVSFISTERNHGDCHPNRSFMSYRKSISLTPLSFQGGIQRLQRSCLEDVERSKLFGSCVIVLSTATSCSHQFLAVCFPRPRIQFRLVVAIASHRSSTVTEAVGPTLGSFLRPIITPCAGGPSAGLTLAVFATRPASGRTSICQRERCHRVLIACSYG